MTKPIRGLWLSLLALGTLGLATASVAWACSAPDYGTPSTPPAPPAASSAATVAPGSSPTSGIGTPSPSPTNSAPSTVSGATGVAPTASGTTSGAVANPVHTSSRTTAPSPSPAGGSGVVAPTNRGSGATVYGAGALATRESGGTAGVSRQGGQSVFTSSVAPPAKAPVAHRHHAVHRAHVVHHATAPVTAPQVAPTHAWSGAGASSRSPLSAAEASSAAQGGGISSQVLAGMVILGLGLVGLFGGALTVTVSRRRRAAQAGDHR